MFERVRMLERATGLSTAVSRKSVATFSFESSPESTTVLMMMMMMVMVVVMVVVVLLVVVVVFLMRC
jgi:heme/copper-type cytochrome/quinol oxidase subunit 2